jgi:hypothetical protein
MVRANTTKLDQKTGVDNITGIARSALAKLINVTACGHSQPILFAQSTSWA